MSKKCLMQQVIHQSSPWRIDKMIISPKLVMAMPLMSQVLPVLALTLKAYGGVVKVWALCHMLLFKSVVVIFVKQLITI